MRHLARFTCVLLCAITLLPAVGCKKADMVEVPDYARPLPPGARALRRIVNVAELPDMTAAFESRDNNLLEALNRSIGWFDRPSTKQFFPIEGIHHNQAHASAFAFRQILATSTSASEFQQRLRDEFDTYISVGWNGQGVVLFTGYYSPQFTASKVQTAEFRYPLYKRPADLVTEPGTGKVLGQRVGSGVQRYPTRAQIEASGMMRGQELVWMRDKLDAYIVQVNGSAKLDMTDGGVMYVGYAGNNGHDYTSIGKLLVEDGKLDKNRLSLPSIRAYFRDHPGELDQYVNRNDRFVFFQPYAGDQWPAGSLGLKVTDFRTLATDKSVFPRGGVVLVNTQVPTGGEGTRDFSQLMLDQDTGGAIRAPGRGDIYMGQGGAAEQLAGRQFAEGKLYYFFLKPHRVSEWLGHLRAVRGGGPTIN